jgi:hypothetical protein
MEIYESVADPLAFARTLDECALRHGAAAVARDGVRAIERFCGLAEPMESGTRRA